MSVRFFEIRSKASRFQTLHKSVWNPNNFFWRNRTVNNIVSEIHTSSEFGHLLYNTKKQKMWSLIFFWKFYQLFLLFWTKTVFVCFVKINFSSKSCFFCETETALSLLLLPQKSSTRFCTKIKSHTLLHKNRFPREKSKIFETLILV